MPLHLSYHQRRLDETLRTLGIAQTHDLHSLIIPPDNELYRCRFLYGPENVSIEFHRYFPRVITSLKLIHDDILEYPHKYSDRSDLDRLFEQRGTCDDVLIVKEGLLSDTTIANIALFIGGKWVTPEQPLLRGTTRSRLIEEGRLFPAVLKVEDIATASKIALMNAMVGFVEVENGIIV